MAAGQGHGGVKTDDGEAPGNTEDFLNDGFPDSGIQVIELCGVVPGHISTIITMVDKTDLPGGGIGVFEHNGRIGTVDIVIFDLNPITRVRREIRTCKTVLWKRTD